MFWKAIAIETWDWVYSYTYKYKYIRNRKTRVRVEAKWMLMARCGAADRKIYIEPKPIKAAMWICVCVYASTMLVYWYWLRCIRISTSPSTRIAINIEKREARQRCDENTIFNNSYLRNWIDWLSRPKRKGKGDGFIGISEFFFSVLQNWQTPEPICANIGHMENGPFVHTIVSINVKCVVHFRNRLALNFGSILFSSSSHSIRAIKKKKTSVDMRLILFYAIASIVESVSG